MEKIPTAEEFLKAECPSYDRNPVEYLTNDAYQALVLIHYPDCKKCKKDTSCKN